MIRRCQVKMFPLIFLPLCFNQKFWRFAPEFRRPKYCASRKILSMVTFPCDWSPSRDGAAPRSVLKVHTCASPVTINTRLRRHDITYPSAHHMRTFNDDFFWWYFCNVCSIFFRVIQKTRYTMVCYSQLLIVSNSVYKQRFFFLDKSIYRN